MLAEVTEEGAAGLTSDLPWAEGKVTALPASLLVSQLSPPGAGLILIYCDELCPHMSGNSHQ